MTRLLQFTINVHKSHRQPRRTSQLMCEDRVSLRWQLRPKCERAIRLLYPSSICKLRCPSSPTHKIETDSNARFTQLYLGNHSQLDNIDMIFFSLTVIDTVPFQNIDLSSWITLYITEL